MSAIFGIIDFEDRPIDSTWIKSMQEDLAHRGPEGQRIYQEKSMFLGHMLLQVTPESIYDKSPYEEDGFIITANARLDEREAIMDRLDLPQNKREIITDPLLLLRSFRKFGKDFVKDIYGDFTFAIWNKEKKELFCARDQMGVKPFLYYFQDNRLVFSTEFKSIVKLTFLKTEIDNSILCDQTFDVNFNHSNTAWKNIFRLPSASTLFINNSFFNIHKFWIPKYKNNSMYKNEEKCLEAFRKLLVKVISDHSRVIDNTGVPLSGGLDSSTIACISAKEFALKGKNLYTISSVLSENYKKQKEVIQDESEYIQSIVNQEKNIIADYIYNTDLSFTDTLLENFEKTYSIFNIFHYLDEAIYTKFGQKSIRRVLSGLYGDMTISNYSINPVLYLFLRGKLRKAYNLCRKIQINTKTSFLETIKSFLVKPLKRIIFYNIWTKFRGKSGIKKALKFPVVLNLSQKRKLQKKFNRLAGINVMEKINISESIWPTNWNLFDEEIDCRSSYHQLEISYPLADRRIVEFLHQIPVEHFYAGGEKRGLIKGAMSEMFPEKVRERTDKLPYSPGYHEIYKKDIPKLISIFNEEDHLKNVKTYINHSSLKKIVNNFDSLLIYNKFDTEYLFYIKLYIWYSFNNIFYKNGNGKKEME